MTNGLPTEVEDQLYIMAAERGCDREPEFAGCEECSSFDSCAEKAGKLASSARDLKKGGSS